MCMCIYIIVSQRIVIELVLGSSPIIFLVIFIQNGAILGSSYWYTCLDIMPQQEGRLPIYLIRGQKRSSEGCSNFKSPETRQVQERLVSTLEHMQVPKWDRTRCPEE